MINTKTDLLQIRIPAPVKAALEEKAKEFGMNMSEYLRFLILEDIRKGGGH